MLARFVAMSVLVSAIFDASGKSAARDIIAMDHTIV